MRFTVATALWLTQSTGKNTISAREASSMPPSSLGSALLSAAGDPIASSQHSACRESLVLSGPSIGAPPLLPPPGTNRVARGSSAHETPIWDRRANRWSRGELRYRLVSPGGHAAGPMQQEWCGLTQHHAHRWPHR